MHVHLFTTEAVQTKKPLLFLASFLPAFSRAVLAKSPLFPIFFSSGFSQYFFFVKNCSSFSVSFLACGLFSLLSVSVGLHLSLTSPLLIVSFLYAKKRIEKLCKHQMYEITYWWLRIFYVLSGAQHYLVTWFHLTTQKKYHGNQFGRQHSSDLPGNLLACLRLKGPRAMRCVVCYAEPPPVTLFFPLLLRKAP